MGGISEEEWRDLDDAYQAAMEEQRKVKALMETLVPIVKRLVVETYPEVFHLESEGYTELYGAIVRNVDRLITDVNHIIYTKQEE